MISLAIDEATQADRMFIRNLARTEKPLHCSQPYSRNLKQLINYLRSAVKLKRPLDKAYSLYMAHWGTPEQESPSQLPETVH